MSVSEMAKRVGLSRSRFYDLVTAGIFPSPVYCLRTRRPMFLTEQQADCLRVRATNIGVNGEYVLFYSPRQGDEPPRRVARNPSSGSGSTDASGEVVAGLRALGMANVTPQQVSSALRQCFPSGWQGHDEGEVLRACWNHLRRTGAA